MTTLLQYIHNRLPKENSRTKASRHEHTSSNHVQRHNRVQSKQHQLFFMMSPSDLLATPSSECLQERCSRHRHWETHENSKYLQSTSNMQTCLESIRFLSRHNVSSATFSGVLSQDNSVPDCSTQHSPLLNSRLNFGLRLHYVHKCLQHDILPKETSEPRAGQTAPKRKDNRLFSRSCKKWLGMPPNYMV